LPHRHVFIGALAAVPPPLRGLLTRAAFRAVSLSHGRPLRRQIDFTSEPWPHISDAAKDCVRRLLCTDPAARPTCSAMLKHDWLVKEGVALDVSLDSVVLSRMSQFANMNRLKKMALMVVGQNLSPEELVGLRELFKSIDTDGSGTITIDELRAAIGKWEHRLQGSEARGGRRPLARSPRLASPRFLRLACPRLLRGAARRLHCTCDLILVPAPLGAADADLSCPPSTNPPQITLPYPPRNPPRAHTFRWTP